MLDYTMFACPSNRAIGHDHAPLIANDMTRILGCTCGWRMPPGITDSDEASAMHTALAQLADAGKERYSMAQKPRESVNEETWLEFLGPPGIESYCGLCGNAGILDTRGKVKGPDGADCGVRAFCLCPNGRTIKHQLGGTLPPEGDLP